MEQSVYRLATGWTTKGSSSSPSEVQTGSGVHPTSYPMGTGASFTGVRWPRCDVDHSPAASAEVK
jgi:hypothetical protein